MAHEEIANAFVQHFYTTLDTNPTGLSSLYQPQSTLTFEGTSVTGADAIVAKYQVSSSFPREFHFVVQNVLVIFKEGRNWSVSFTRLEFAYLKPKHALLRH